MAFSGVILAILLMLTGALADDVFLPVTTRYITTMETTLLQTQSKTFTATLCNRFNGHALNATVLLNNNPSWDPAFGVVDYYITDSPSKARNESSCTNKDSSGKRHSHCYVSKWTSSSDLFLVVTAGEVDSIVFSIDIEIQPMKMPARQKIAEHMKLKPSYRYQPQKQSHRIQADPELLTEIVNVQSIQSLQYHQKAFINVTFCKNSQTSDNYQISSTVTGTDGKSSYAQYLCSASPCEVDGKNIIGFDGKQLPNNVVHLSTQSGQYQDFTVLVICWSGEFDPKLKTYVGQFQYTAQINKAPQ